MNPALGLLKGTTNSTRKNQKVSPFKPVMSWWLSSQCLTLKSMKLHNCGLHSWHRSLPHPHTDPASSINFTSRWISKPPTPLCLHTTPLAKIPFSLARTRRRACCLFSLFLRLFPPTFSPQNSKGHLYTVNMTLTSSLLKTTGLTTKILHKVQVSYEVWPHLSLQAHFWHFSVHSQCFSNTGLLFFSWMLPAPSHPKASAHASPSPSLCLLLSQIPAPASSLKEPFLTLLIQQLSQTSPNSAGYTGVWMVKIYQAIILRHMYFSVCMLYFNKKIFKFPYA